MGTKTQDLTILRMGQNGEGVATLADGRVVFVAGGLPGERVRAEVTDERKSFARARAKAVLQPSPDRQSPPCPVFDACGGCNFQHWSYAAELAYKEAWVQDSLSRIAHLDGVVVKPIIGADHPYGYRNKGQFPWGLGADGRPVLGLFAAASHQVVAVGHCAIQSSVINRVLAVAPTIAARLGLSVYQEATGQGLLRHLLVRSAKDESTALAAIIVSQGDPRLVPMAEAMMAEVPELVGVTANLNHSRGNRVLGEASELLAGRPYFVDHILSQKFRVSAETFFQVNPAQVERLYRTVLDAVPARADQIWDLYAGVGTLACLVAPMADEVWAVEINSSAVRDAQMNVLLNRLQNVRVDVGKVEQWLSDKPWRTRADLVIVDPPRSGLNPSVVQALLELGADRLLYVSCNPSTLARDLALLHPRYRIEWVQPVDMFARTDHVESCTSLRRDSS